MISKGNFLQIEIFFFAGGIYIYGSVVQESDLLDGRGGISNPGKCWMDKDNFGLTSGQDGSEVEYFIILFILLTYLRIFAGY